MGRLRAQVVEGVSLFTHLFTALLISLGTEVVYYNLSVVSVRAGNRRVRVRYYWYVPRSYGTALAFLILCV